MIDGPITDLPQTWIRQRLRPGATVIDATAGNGHDTVFLARLVGPAGRVFAFDIQAEALESTRRRLESESLAGRVRLIHASHEMMAQHVEQADAVMFNLGYLPGGDKSVVTRTETTLTALEAARQLLAPGGVLTIVAYTGHEGGDDEGRRVLESCQALDPAEFRSIRFDKLNSAKPSPFVIGIERLRTAVSSPTDR